MCIGPRLAAAAIAALLAGATPAAGASWSLVEGGPQGAKLVYGEPDTDVVALMLLCTTGEDVDFVLSLDDGDEPSVRAIALRSGNTRRNLTLRPPPIPDGYPYVSARIDRQDVWLAGFAATGLLRVRDGRAELRMDARSAAERASVGDFLRGCPSI